MQNDLLNRLRAIGTKMTAAWPEMAVDLVHLERSKDLTLRDLAVLLLLAPGEHAARAAVESLVPEGEADAAIGAVIGYGFAVEDPKGLCLTDRGRAFVQQLIDIRVDAVCRLLGTLPEETRETMVRGLEEMARQLPRSEALATTKPLEPA